MSAYNSAPYEPSQQDDQRYFSFGLLSSMPGPLVEHRLLELSCQIQVLERIGVSMNSLRAYRVTSTSLELSRITTWPIPICRLCLSTVASQLTLTKSLRGACQ